MLISLESQRKKNVAFGVGFRKKTTFAVQI